jgi:hypothetical protein
VRRRRRRQLKSAALTTACVRVRQSASAVRLRVRPKSPSRHYLVQVRVIIVRTSDPAFNAYGGGVPLGVRSDSKCPPSAENFPLGSLWHGRLNTSRRSGPRLGPRVALAAYDVFFLWLESARASPVNSFSGVLQYKTNTHRHTQTHTDTHTQHRQTDRQGGFP